MRAELIDSLRSQLGAELIETHISWVLLAGDDAWKIKKPVQPGFLDFGTLDARRRMCEEELRLNRRLAPELYLAVVRVTGTPSAPRLGGLGPAIEYALHMRRFPAGALLSERLAAGTLSPELVDGLAERIAEFHAQAPVAGVSLGWATPELIAEVTNDTLENLADHLSGSRAAWLPRLRAWAEAQAGALREAWTVRRRDGWVREGHGDLHLANTVVLAEQDAETGALHERATAFDCIEFDPALRWIDVQSDIGFLVMDLAAHGRADLAFRCLDRYVQASGDAGGLAVLPYYLVYRALVRALVAALRSSQSASAAAAGPDYLVLALAWSAPRGGRLLITHGVSGSGKSWVAERLLEQARAVRLRSDVVRKRLFGLGPLADSAAQVPGGIYGPEATERTYARLAELAGAALDAGWAVIVDAAFLRAHERGAFRDLARQRGLPFTILHCDADPQLLHQRVAARQARGDDASEADTQVLEMQLRSTEPLADAEQAGTILLDTGAPLDVDALAARWAAAT